MRSHALRGRRRETGAALVLGLVFVALAASLAVAFATSSALELRKSANSADGAQAQLAAESGLTYYQYLLRDVRFDPGVTAETLLDGLQSSLGEKLSQMDENTQPMFTRVGNTLSISPISLAQGAFSAQFTVSDGDPLTCYLTVTGSKGGAARRTRLLASCVPRRSAVFDYGVACRGAIVVSGSALLEGVNEAGEASILSTREEPVAIEAGGHAEISGDLFVTGSDLNYVLLKGSVSIGGTDDIEEILSDHVCLGTQDPEFPELDIDPIAALATTTVNADTDFSGTTTFNNIRVEAGTDPSFASGTVINGVLVIEAPNKVTFSGSCTINGIIVTEPAEGASIDDCQIDFRGSSSIPGVSALEDTEEWADVKAFTGSVILAPGFGLTFRGNTNAVNGAIAADQLSFSGASGVEGTFTGAILGLANTELSLQGNTTIRINREGDVGLAAGFKHPKGLDFDPDSYVEPPAD